MPNPMQYATGGNNDRRDKARAALQQAVNAGDTAAFAQAYDDMVQVVADDIRQEYQQQLDSMQEAIDSQVLTARGVRQLTSEEREYYQAFARAAASDNPRQAVENLNVTLPRTVINSVFEDLRQNHPLLSEIDFVPTNGAIQLLMSTDDYQAATWGELCDEIIKEISSGFQAVDTTLFKLSAFIPVCKDMLDLGPEWLDRYVREFLYEVYANGWEAGIASGDGKGKPIGMNRQVGKGVTVTDGVYPEKAKIKISDLYPETIGGLLAQLAVTPNGKTRNVKNVIMVVNPVDYFQKLMPSTTVAGADGAYRNDVMPYPVKLIPSPSVAQGEARFGLGKRYFAATGSAKDGKIEYSDHEKFTADKRMYLIKGYGNGMPKDNNSFLNLDISELKATMFRAILVEQGAQV